MYYHSIGALKKILLYNSRNANNRSDNDKVDGNNNLLSTSPFCSINRVPTGILHMANGEEYYHLELICNDDTEYLIQAYGEEAKALYREINRFDTSSKDAAREKVKFVLKENEEEQHKEKFAPVKSEIDYITNFSFNSKNGYSLVFKKLKDVCISKKKKIKTEFSTFS
jgi:hypothetical protein